MEEEAFKLPRIPLLQLPVRSSTAISTTSTPIAVTGNVASTSSSQASSPSKKIVATQDQSLTGLQLPKLCPSCSIVLLQYLKPLQQYLNQVLNLTLGNLASETEASTIIQDLKENLVSLAQPSQEQHDQNSSKDNQKVHSNQNVQQQSKTLKPEERSQSHHHQRLEDLSRRNHERKCSQCHETTASTEGHQHQISTTEYRDVEAKSVGNINQFVHQNGVLSDSPDYKHQPSVNWSHDHGRKNEQAYSRREAQLPPSGNFSQPREERHEKRDEYSRTDNSINEITTSVSQTLGESVRGEFFERADQSEFVSQSEESTESPQSTLQDHQESTVSVSSTGVAKQQDLSPTTSPENAPQSFPTAMGRFDEYHDSSDYSFYEPQAEDESICPFAFVTIVYDNLSAVNAIILANSLVLSSAKRITYDEKTFKIPLIVVLGGPVDKLLLNHFDNIFDEVITSSHDARLSLLSDESFGVSHAKIQLWKNLSDYEKCFFIESTSLVVGNIDDVFLSCNELTATVDWMFPDSFSCSVFVFEPNIATYNRLVSFATQMVQDADDPDLISVDEMTILNEFFSSKWQKMSFIYNYTQNTGIYTQTPAFARYGGSIKIVNFDFTPVGIPGGNRDGGSSSQPWHVQFNLNQSVQSGQVHANTSINNYVRFYLDIFLKRVWPLLREVSLLHLFVKW
jgi:hypothetical protein